MAVEGQGNQHQIDWGNCPNWADRYRDDLNNAHRISLIPKKIGGHLPIVTVAMGEGRRWIVFSRVFGRMGQEARIRLYAIGWQATVKGRNVRSINWIYPNGTVENAIDPSLWMQFLDVAAGM